jgi:hypothetical protein
MKHIDVRHHFMREVVERGEILVKHIRQQDNPADMLTHPTTPIEFRKQRGQIMDGKPALGEGECCGDERDNGLGLDVVITAHGGEDGTMMG